MALIPSSGSMCHGYRRPPGGDGGESPHTVAPETLFSRGRPVWPVDIAIMDGFTDEPAALGVPPYLAPLPRYVAGAAWAAGAEGVLLSNIERVRTSSRMPGHRGTRRGRNDRMADRRPLSLPDADGFDLLVIIGGAVVPGKYLGGRPASARELAEIASSFPGPTVLVGPVARWGWTSGAPMSDGHARAFDLVARLDGDAFVHDLITTGEVPEDRLRTNEEWARWAVEGADIVSSIPERPHPLIVEIETYRGCVRYPSGCSFCTTVRDAEPVFREPSEIASEVQVLDAIGVVSYRLGGQSCIYSYRALDVGKAQVPQPDPRAIESLLKGVRRAAPSLEVLHVDNANPAVLAEHPREAELITQLLVDQCTGGNVVALGLESADPAVKAANNLNATPEQCLKAIRTINEWGAPVGDTGLPALLPGINFLAGLPGETPATFDLNMAFLRKVLDEGLLLRRINIRQVSPVGGGLEVRQHPKEFRGFKLHVRRDVDLPMLQAMLPFGAPLKGVWTEVHDGNTTFGRQIGSYPLLVGIPGRLDLHTFRDVRVVGYGMRSVTAVSDPFPINECPLAMLEGIPGIGRKRAARIVRGRPYRTAADLLAALDDVGVAEMLTDLAAL
jgi:radical SAM superfamily enzyme with C-terminal helix-hairpin-helix motif